MFKEHRPAGYRAPYNKGQECAPWYSRGDSQPSRRDRQALHQRSSLSGVEAAGLLASGESRDSILRAYPYLESADIDEALRYARTRGGRNDRAREVKFLVDMPLSPEMARWLRSRVTMPFTQ